MPHTIAVPRREECRVLSAVTAGSVRYESWPGSLGAIDRRGFAVTAAEVTWRPEFGLRGLQGWPVAF